MKIERVIFILFLLVPSLVLGAENADGVLTMLRDGLFAWIPSVKRACLWVFWVLVTIDVVWTFGLQALSGFEFGEFLAALVKKIMYIGIFLFLFDTDRWLQIIFDSFSQLATNANSGISVTPQNITEKALDIVGKIFESLDLDIGESFLKVICGVIILIAFVLMAIDLLIVYLKFYIMNIVVFFALTLGGLNHFKQIGLNPIITGVKVGVELFMIQGLMALCITTIQKIHEEFSGKISTEIVTSALTTALIFCMITKVIPGLIEAVFGGGLGEGAGSSAGFKTVVAAAGGAVAGGVTGAIGATRAIRAAKALHYAEGGGSGMSMIQGVAKNLLGASKEQLRDSLSQNSASNKVANRLQERLGSVQAQKSQTNLAPSSKSEPYQSGVGSHATKSKKMTKKKR